MKHFIVGLFVALTLLSSCLRKKQKTDFITKRIQYDVTIKSPDPEFDWWVQHIEGLNRETLIGDLLNAAYRGKIKTYDPFLLTENTVEQVKKLGTRYETVRLKRDVDPYDEYDTVFQKGISIHDITRIRFLEEWTIDRNGMRIDKHILGIALMAENYDDTGLLRGYMPLFWIFYDDAYPGKLKGIPE